MKKWFILLFLATLLYGEDYYAEIPVYQEISSLTNPTKEDLFKVQRYLTFGEREIARLLKDTERSARSFKMIGRTAEEQPEYGKIAVNCDESDRENCLVTYSSFNKNYPRGLRRLVEFVRHSDFRGHVLYWIGGWPNLAHGSLTLAHVPYAYKVAAMKEAEAMGFKRVLWLDSSILPVVSLNDIFKMIQENGYFSMGNAHYVGPYTNSLACSAFGLTKEDTDLIPSCSAGLTGVDFTTEIGKNIVDRWYKAAHSKVAFFSARSDQNVLSIILYQMGLTSCPIERLAHGRAAINDKTLFLIERGFVY